MATQRVAFTEWLPDQPTTTGALLEANTMPLILPSVLNEVSANALMPNIIYPLN